MYAVIQTGGKQYRVAENDVIRVEKLLGEAGEAVELDQVLMLGNGADAQIGAPLVEGARVVATILEQARAPKIIVFKKKRRKNYRRTKGHRQNLTVLRVTDILSAGEKPKKVAKLAAPEKAKPAKPAAAAKKPEKAPAKKADTASAKTTATPAAKAAPKTKAAPKKAEKAPAKAPVKTKAPAKAKSKAPAKAKESIKTKAGATKTTAKKSASAKTTAKAKPAAKPGSGKSSGKGKA